MRVPAFGVRFPADDPSLRDLAAAQLDGTEATAIDDGDNYHWRVFYPAAEARDAAHALFEPFARAHGLSTNLIEVEDEDWARRSQAQLRAIRVGDIMVAPPWDLSGRGTRPEAPPEARGTRPEVLIVIEPSMGFGTGHHASTRLCLRAMQMLDLRGKAVIDVGTGSGILAIAAVMLGAARVTAIDTDADAIASARENGALNGVAVDWHVADVAASDHPYPGEGGRSGSFDIVLANLTGAWLRRLCTPLLGLADRGGTFVLSGLQTSERDGVLESFAAFSHLGMELEEEGWSALVLAKSHP